MPYNRGPGKAHNEVLKYHRDIKGNSILRKLQQKTLSAAAVYKNTNAPCYQEDF